MSESIFFPKSLSFPIDFIFLDALMGHELDVFENIVIFYLKLWTHKFKWQLLWYNLKKSFSW